MSRIGYRVFFPPQSLAIVVDRPDKGSGYDRTIDFELAVGVASSSTRNRNRKDDVRIVVAGELVTLRCEAGNCFENLPTFFIFCVRGCNRTIDFWLFLSTSDFDRTGSKNRK